MVHSNSCNEVIEKNLSRSWRQYQNLIKSTYMRMSTWVLISSRGQNILLPAISILSKVYQSSCGSSFYLRPIFTYGVYFLENLSSWPLAFFFFFFFLALIYSRAFQPTARGSHVAHKAIFCGPQSPLYLLKDLSGFQ